MSGSAQPRRAVALVRGGAPRPDWAVVGSRPIYQFWHLLSPHFRDVLLPPQRRSDGGGFNWSWRDAGSDTPPSAAELADLRQRLKLAERTFTAASTEPPWQQDPDEADGPRSLGAKVKAAAQAMVAQYTSAPDAVLAGFVCRTESGPMLHSWGASVPAAPVFVDALECEIGGTVLLGDESGAGLDLVLENRAGAIIAQTRTDLSGLFLFRKIPAGDYRIRVDHRGDFPTTGFSVSIEQDSIYGLELRRGAAVATYSRVPSRAPFESHTPVEVFSNVPFPLHHRSRRPLLLALLGLALLGGAGAAWYFLSGSSRTDAGKSAVVWQAARGAAGRAPADGGVSGATVSGAGHQASSLSLGRGERPDFLRRGPPGDGRPVAQTAGSPIVDPAANPAFSADDNADAGSAAGLRSGAASPGTRRAGVTAQGGSRGRSAPEPTPAADPAAAVDGAAVVFRGAPGASAEPRDAMEKSGGRSARPAARGDSGGSRKVGAAAADAGGVGGGGIGPPDAGGGGARGLFGAGQASRSAGKGRTGTGPAGRPEGGGAPPAGGEGAPAEAGGREHELEAGRARTGSVAAAARTATGGNRAETAALSSESAAEIVDAVDSAGLAATSAARKPGALGAPPAAGTAATVRTGSGGGGAPVQMPEAVTAESGEKAGGTPARSAATSRRGPATARDANPDTAAGPDETGPDRVMARAPVAAGEGPDLPQRHRVVLAAGGVRLLRDAILPTQPMPIGRAEPIERLRRRLREEQEALIPAEFRQPVTARGVALEIPAPAVAGAGWPRWIDAAGAAPAGASVDGGRAELAWRGPTPVAGEWRLVRPDGGELARVDLAADGIVTVRAIPAARSLIWVGVEGTGSADRRLEWWTLTGAAVPASWPRAERWTGGHGARLEMPLGPGGGLLESVGLVDPASGWAVTFEVGRR